MPKRGLVVDPFGDGDVVIPGGGSQVPGGIPTTTTDTGGQNELTNREGLLVQITPLAGHTYNNLFTQVAGAYYFQCPPLDEMPREKTWEWEDYGTVGSGMHSNPNYPGLAVVAFDTLFVDEDWGFSFASRLPSGHAANQDQIAAAITPGPRYAVANLPHDVLWAIDWLEQLGDQMQPFVLSWGQRALWGRWDRVMAATLRSIRVAEKGGENDSRYLSMSFTEWADAAPADLGDTILPGVPGSGSTGGVTDPNGKDVLAVLDSSRLPPNERTLYAISKVFYGDPSLWRIIQNASGLAGVPPTQDLPTTVGLRNPPAKIIVPFRPRTGN